MAKREYTSRTTYLNEVGALVVMDADGAIRDEPIDVPGELARLRAHGRELVEMETSETVLHDVESQTVLMTSYLLQRDRGAGEGEGA